MQEEYSDFPELKVQKYASYFPVSEDLAMEYGLIPDTREPVVYSKRERFSWFIARHVERFRLKLGSWIAGIDLRDDDWC